MTTTGIIRMGARARAPTEACGIIEGMVDAQALRRGVWVYTLTRTSCGHDHIVNAEDTIAAY
jgi:hypothetical protein